MKCDTACESVEKAGSMAVIRKFESSIPKLVGAVVLMTIGVYDGAVVATAQGAQDRRAIRQACAADYQSLCSGVQQGGGRVIACLQQNAAKLSPACRKAVEGARTQQ